MSIACPKCIKQLPVSRIRSAFSCPSCGIKLRSNHFTIALVALPLAAILELCVFAFFSSELGSIPVAIKAYGMIFPFVGYLLYWLAVQKFTMLWQELS